MKALPNRDLASLAAVPPISPWYRRGSVPPGNISCSTVTDEYQRNGRKRRCVLTIKYHTDRHRFQRRLSRGSYPSSESLSPSRTDPISSNPRSCTDFQTTNHEEDLQKAPLLVDSSGATFALSVHRASQLSAELRRPLHSYLAGV